MGSGVKHGFQRGPIGFWHFPRLGGFADWSDVELTKLESLQVHFQNALPPQRSVAVNFCTGVNALNKLLAPEQLKLKTHKVRSFGHEAS